MSSRGSREAIQQGPFIATISRAAAKRRAMALLVRDLVLPVLWLGALFGDDFVWRGNEMAAAANRRRRNVAAEAATRPAPQLTGPY